MPPAKLLSAKLRSLVAAQLGASEREPADFPGGAALVSGPTGWLLLDSTPLAALGPALVWADRRKIADLHLLVEADAGLVARRARLFSRPPAVWHVDGTSLLTRRADFHIVRIVCVCRRRLSRVVEGTGPTTPQQPGGNRPGANSCPMPGKIKRGRLRRSRQQFSFPR